MLDADAEALSLYDRAGCDPEDPPGVLFLARCLLGSTRAVVEHRGIRNTAVLYREGRQIWVRPGMTPRRLAYAVAHELAEWHLGAYDGADREDRCDSLAAALVAPAPAVRLAVREHGRHLPTLAAAMVATESVMVLRLGEVTGSPLALVTPRRVHVRGEPCVWPEEYIVRRWAKAVPGGVSRLEITDAPRRCALFLDAA